MQKIEDFLDSQNITYVLHEHPPVFTCEDVEKYCPNLPGMDCKNLFLRDQKKQSFFLLVLPATKRADLKKFAEIISEKKLSFASPEDLKAKLELEPGAVSPFGLINDTQKSVQVYLDKDVAEAKIITFHPNRNTASLELTNEMFHKFLKAIGHKINIINL